MRVLAGGVEGVVILAGVVRADGRARLDGIWHQAVVDQVQLRDVVCLGERSVRGSLVAEFPLERGVAAGHVMHLGCTLLLGVAGVNHGWQRLVGNVDGFRGRARLLTGRCDDHGHRVAYMARTPLCQQRVRAGLHRRAVLGMDHPAADQAAEIVLGDVFAGQHRDDTRQLQRGLCVDLLDFGVRMR